MEAKIVVAGIGGQGVVFLTNLLVESALAADIRAGASEIHGLSQRGGSVVTGITLGEKYHGFVQKGGADFVLGLEPLEAMRCTPYLHSGSTVLIDDRPINPHQVQAGNALYPDVEIYRKTVGPLIRNLVLIEDVSGIKDILRNVFVLGVASRLPEFPLSPEHISRAIRNTASPEQLESTLEAFDLGRNYNIEEKSTAYGNSI